MNEKIEDLFLRSLDGKLNDQEQAELDNALRNDELSKQFAAYRSIRENLGRTQQASFGPYFAQKVIYKIQNTQVEIDQLIAFFFRKYQLALVGVFIALLTINVIFSEQFNLPSVLGIQEEAATDEVDEDIEAFDFSNNLTNNENDDR